MRRNFCTCNAREGTRLASSFRNGNGLGFRSEFEPPSYRMRARDRVALLAAVLVPIMRASRYPAEKPVTRDATRKVSKVGQIGGAQLSESRTLRRG